MYEERRRLARAGRGKKTETFVTLAREGVYHMSLRELDLDQHILSRDRASFLSFLYETDEFAE